MTDAVASVTAAVPQRVLLERSPQASRTIDALRYTLDAMRSERASGETPAAPPTSTGRTFADEIRRQAAIAEPRDPPAVERASAPTLPQQPEPPASAAPLPPLPPLPEWRQPEAAARPPAAAASEDIPLDVMQWARGVGSEERGAPRVSFDEPAPAAVIAPDIARLSQSEQNHIPQDVLEIMRSRHLGAELGPTNGR
jgi:hypothetical protein